MNFPSSDQKVIPKAVNDVKLIYAGKVLENTKTIAESRIPVGELPGVVSTMHVVVQPSMERKKTGLFYLQYLCSFLIRLLMGWMRISPDLTWLFVRSWTESAPIPNICSDHICGSELEMVCQVCE